MASISVYSHTIEVGGERQPAEHKRTADAIDRLAYRGAAIIPGTEEVVDSSLIDGQGRYLPPQGTPHA